jgi:S-adenosylmethionine/arginine decarboxylase-like enzyme
MADENEKIAPPAEERKKYLYTGIKDVLYFVAEFDDIDRKVLFEFKRTPKRIEQELGLTIIDSMYVDYGGGSKSVLCALRESHLVISLSYQEKFLEVELATCKRINNVVGRFLESLRGMGSKWKLKHTDYVTSNFTTYSHGLV